VPEHRPTWTAVIADDVAAVRRLVVARLRLDGHELREAADGFEALQKVTERPPDLLIVDDVLPGLSGVELVQELGARHELAGIRIAFLIEYRSGVARAAQAGLSEAAVIRKPFDLDDVARQVGAIMAAP
jgi:CheY-like chemotaxis protein